MGREVSGCLHACLGADPQSSLSYQGGSTQPRRAMETRVCSRLPLTSPSVSQGYWAPAVCHVPHKHQILQPLPHFTEMETKAPRYLGNKC